ncbi:hypothetical protein AMS59_09790 [Lysinibacillus sp. FJAT-14745]|nr:hypothetical protein AMS59_09790 [Lysinibacillus sp. FJAT-14745]
MWSSIGISISSERKFRCECGFVAERDWNAAINIKHEGLRLLAFHSKKNFRNKRDSSISFHWLLKATISREAPTSKNVRFKWWVVHIIVIKVERK